MLGYASQLRLLPVSPEAIERAVEINGVAVPFNKAAFALGRLQAVDPARLEKAVVQNIPEMEFTPLTALTDIVVHGNTLLTDYQTALCTARFLRLRDAKAS